MVPIDVEKHQTFVDGKGDKVSVLLPYAEYEELLRIADHYRQLQEFEEKLHRSLKYAKEVRAGKRPRRTLSSLIAEISE